VEAKGDLHIDGHHTVEDIGITWARLSPRRRRQEASVATATVRPSTRRPRVVVDFSGRPGLEFHVPFTRGLIGEFDVDLVHEFFQGFVNHAQVTLHVDNLRGANAHHQAETAFKAFGRALRMRRASISRSGAVPSTKGTL
jgi:imidazoleglycerol-phosphate dehydratase